MQEQPNNATTTTTMNKNRFMHSLPSPQRGLHHNLDPFLGLTPQALRRTPALRACRFPINSCLRAPSFFAQLESHTATSFLYLSQGVRQAMLCFYRFIGRRPGTNIKEFWN